LKGQHPITKKVLRQLKQPRCVSIMDRLVILPIDAQIHVSVPPLHLTPTDLKLLQMQTKFEEIKSASTMDRRSLCSLMPQPTCLPSSYTVIYFSTTTQPASQRERGSASERLRTGMTCIWKTTR
jgi:hypothetical protein